MTTVRSTLLLVWLLSPTLATSTGGGVELYLQPFPPEAARLTFGIASVSAVAADGTEYPLDLSLRTAGPGEAGRQRLVASGRVPPGRYDAFLFKVTRASLKGGSGEVALVVPDAPVRTDVDLAVADGRTSLLWLTLKYPDSMMEEARFNPAFSAATPPRPVADRLGFVTNSDSNTITVFDKRLAQVVAVIDTCAGPAGMALDQRRRRLYVACTGDEEIQSIDVATGEIAERVRSSPGDRPIEVALTPDGLTLIAVNPGSNSITFHDALSLARSERLNVGDGPRSVLVDSAGRRAFVFNTLSSSISVVDIPARSLAATVTVDAPPLRAQFNATGNRLFVIHERSPYLTVLDPATLTVLNRVRLGAAVGAIAVDNIRGLVCLGGGQETAIEFYDPNALMPLFSLRTTAAVERLAIDHVDSRLYMLGGEGRSVVIAGLADRKIVAEIDVGRRPYWVAVMGEQ